MRKRKKAIALTRALDFHFALLIVSFFFVDPYDECMVLIELKSN